jgi:hypothetical protein
MSRCAIHAEGARSYSSIYAVIDGVLLEVFAMKRLSQALVVASLLAAPFVAYAAGVAPLTRAQVRADLIAAEQNGTYPTSKVHYPDPQRDPATVYVANRAAAKAAAENAYGGSADSHSASGIRAGGAVSSERPPLGNLYSHH